MTKISLCNKLYKMLNKILYKTKKKNKHDCPFDDNPNDPEPDRKESFYICLRKNKHKFLAKLINKKKS